MFDQFDYLPLISWLWQGAYAPIFVVVLFFLAMLMRTSAQKRGPTPIADSEVLGDAGQEDFDAEATVLAALSIDEGRVVELLAVPQRHRDGQAHELWISARRDRLTASRFAAACGAEGSKSNPRDVVADMLSLPEARGSRMRFGIQNEARARNEYVRRRRREQTEAGREPDVDVREVGICVWREEPWLAASPDGVCWESGSPAGLLEVKTARNWTDRMEAEPPVDWVYQIQGCMRVASAALGTDLTWCDLFLWTPGGRCRCLRVAFDAELWETRMFPKLRNFYFDKYLPRAADRERARVNRAKGPGRRRVARKLRQAADG